MLPFGKISLVGARSIIKGGGVRLTTYADDSLKSRPYREWFPGVKGYWPKHRYRLAWTWLFDLKPFRWIALTGSEAYQEEDPPHPYLGQTELADEWNQGPHMPGMMRIDMGGFSIPDGACRLISTQRGSSTSTLCAREDHVSLPSFAT